MPLPKRYSVILSVEALLSGRSKIFGSVFCLGLTVTDGITAAFPISVSTASTKEQPLTFTR